MTHKTPGYTRDERGRIVSNGHDAHMGTLRDARKALEMYRNRDYGITDGMRYVDAGVHRATFAPDGAFRATGGKWYAYKVDRDGRANRAEYEACHELRRVEKAIAPPTRILYYEDGPETVLVMPFYPGSAHDARPMGCARFNKVVQWHGLQDMHDGNWRATRNGHARITDLGFGAHIREDRAPITPGALRKAAARPACDCGRRVGHAEWCDGSDGSAGRCPECGEQASGLQRNGTNSGSLSRCRECRRHRCKDCDRTVATRDARCNVCRVKCHRSPAHCMGAAGHDGAGLDTRMREHRLMGTCGRASRHVAPAAPQPTAPGQVRAWSAM